ncbi:MAG: PadR family transcriptional regulator [Candidatus Izemoplasmatales bacterium]|nr:PadR family transcriptional regulator [Candidatus Izemoplasmatales bacterium]
MNLAGEALRGHTNAIILSILAENDSYGYEINQIIASRSGTGTYLTEPTLYNAFRRLEQDGCIRSYWMDGINNTKRKYYSITEYGKKVLEEHRQEFLETTKVLNRFLGGKQDD